MQYEAVYSYFGPGAAGGLVSCRKRLCDNILRCGKWLRLKQRNQQEHAVGASSGDANGNWHCRKLFGCTWRYLYSPGVRRLVQLSRNQQFSSCIEQRGIKRKSRNDYGGPNLV